MSLQQRMIRKKAYCKLALQSHPDKNKHQQASDAFCMINESKKGLEDILRHNYAMRRTQEIEEDLQRQEEAWREYEQIRKAQEETEERNKQAEMGACMNKYQQVPEYQQASKQQWSTQRNKNVSIWHDNLSKFCLIPRPIRHQMTRWKHRRMTHLI